MLHRVPESDKSEASARAGDDIKFFKQLTEDVLGFGDLKPTKAIRVGAKKTSKDSDGTTAERLSSRPLKIVLPSKEDRDLVFGNLRKLRAADKWFASISVSRPLARSEEADQVENRSGQKQRWRECKKLHVQIEMTSEQTRGTETEAESETFSGEPRRCLRRQSLKFLFSNTDAMTNKKEEISARLVKEKPDVFGLMELKPKKHGMALCWRKQISLLKDMTHSTPNKLPKRNIDVQ